MYGNISEFGVALDHRSAVILFHSTSDSVSFVITSIPEHDPFRYIVTCVLSLSIQHSSEWVEKWTYSFYCILYSTIGQIYPGMNIIKNYL